METNLNELFRIDNSSIEESFTRISKELFNNFSLRVNDSIFLFTEIEFYYFYQGIHEDKNTHNHKYNQPSGKWRCHSQGLDITFEFNDISDGGILVRGISTSEGDIYINGPLRVVYKIFDCLNDVFTTNSGIFLEKLHESLIRNIYKTSRQGIKQDPKFLEHKYRYFTELDRWDWKTLGSTYQKNIEKDKDPNPVV